MISKELERIHTRISFVKGHWRIDAQEIQEGRLIGRTIKSSALCFVLLVGGSRQ
jgi:hypothetical protein